MTDVPRNLEFAVDPYRNLEPVGDRVTPFLFVLESYEQRHWQIPDHQRKPDAWDFNKQRRYIERLRNSQFGNHPPGIFATYQIKGEETAAASPVFLNDGLQRVTTLESLRAGPADFGMDDRGVMELLRQSVTIQHRHYASHEDAMRDFQLMNDGSRLTPYELCHGVLTYMPSYEKVWGPVISDVHESVESSWKRLGINGKTVNRETRHKMNRQVLALIHRFVTDVKEPKAYVDVGRREIALDNWERVIEVQLRREMENLGVDEFRRRGSSLCRLITNETAAIETIRDEVLSPGTGIVPVLHRWLLDFAVWARNNKIPVVSKSAFLRALLIETRGKNQWVSSDKEVVTFAFSHLGVIPKLAVWADVPDLAKKQRRKQANTAPSRPGYQDSHMQPYSIFGEGETIKEAAVLNMARGAKPI